MTAVQHVTTQIPLPVWIEYTKALGAPIVAVLAALIAGVISSQQLRTTRNKLKLDLFEKRFGVYEAGTEIIREIITPSTGYGKRLTELTNAVSGARWLLNAAIIKHLDELLTRAWERVELDRDLDGAGISDEQRQEEIRAYQVDTQAFMRVELDQLNKLFDRFLSVEH